MKQVCMKQFPSTAYWKVLQPETSVVSEIENKRFKVARYPPITDVEAKCVLQKYNFSHRFDVPKFEAVETEIDLDLQGIQRRILLLVNEYRLQRQGRRVV